MKKTKRKGFLFYRSYYDVFNELEDKDKLQFIKALLDKEFLDLEPEGLEGMAKFAWISQYNSIDDQVKGYKSKTKDAMRGENIPLAKGGCEGVQNTPSLQEKEKEKEKDKDKRAENKFSAPTFEEFKNYALEKKQDGSRKAKTKV